MFQDILDSIKYKEYPSISELLGKMVVPYGSNPGLYNFTKTPYYNEVLKNLESRDIEIISLMIAAQLGKTQLLICIALAWAIKYSTPVYFCVPTNKVAIDHFHSKIMPIVEATPFLSELLIKDATTGKTSRKSQKGLSVRFQGGGSLVMDFAGARTFLQSYSTSLLVLDEYDKIESSMRKDASSLIENAKARISSFASKNKKILAASTPTAKGKGIDDLRDTSVQYTYKIACPSCGTVQTPDFYNLYNGDNVKDALTLIELGNQLRSINTDSQLHLRCSHCSYHIEEWLKPTVNSNGFYEEEINLTGRRDQLSYSVSGLMGLRKWKDVYMSWILANIEHKEKKTTKGYRAFNNEVIGIPYEVRLSPTLKLEDLKLGNFLKKDNRDIHSIATGIDVQTEQRIIYVSVVGFIGAGKYALIDWYSMAYANEHDLKDIIRNIHLAKYGSLPNKFTFVDTGGSIGTVVTEICKAISYRSCIGVKGSPRARDWTYRGPSTPENYKPLLVHPHRTNQRLDELIQEGLEFPSNFDDAVFFTHLKNEVPKLVKGDLIYEKINSHAPNDYRDALRYALFGGIHEKLETKKPPLIMGF